MTSHTLKTWPVYFDAVADGRKRFEVRSTKDSTFAVGDVLVLREWDPQTETYLGRSVRVVVTYMLGWPFAPEGNVILSIAPDHLWRYSDAHHANVCDRCGAGGAYPDRQCVTKGDGP